MTFDLDNKKIYIHRDNNVVEYDILFTFDSMDTKKSYVGYTNHTFSSDGREKIYVSAYNPMNLGIELDNISEQKEIHMLQTVLYEIDKTSKKGEEQENES